MSRHPAILVVEDDDILGSSLANRLRLEGMQPVWAKTAGEAIDLIDSSRFDAVVSDIRLPDGSGEDIFWADHNRFGLTPTIFTTAYGEVDQAVRLVKLGAIDYLTKPYDLSDLVERLKALTADGLRDDDEIDAFAASSVAFRSVLDMAHAVADTRETILIAGPAGTGKKALARHIHACSSREAAPFVVVEAAALAAEAGERLLFGSAEADRHAPGLLDETGSGTLLISEIADLPAAIQPRLLRLFDQRLYRPVGSTEERPFSGRFITSSSLSPADLVTSGAARFELIQAIGVIELYVPPLVERRDDILALAERFLRQCNASAGRGGRFADEARRALLAYEWPGNVRELRNRVVRASLLSRTDAIVAADLFPDLPHQSDLAGAKLETARQDAERQVILNALAENGGRIVETARILGISRVTLWSKMKRLGIEKD